MNSSYFIPVIVLVHACYPLFMERILFSPLNLEFILEYHVPLWIFHMASLPGLFTKQGSECYLILGVDVHKFQVSYHGKAARMLSSTLHLVKDLTKQYCFCIPF